MRHELRVQLLQARLDRLLVSFGFLETVDLALELRGPAKLLRPQRFEAVFELPHLLLQFLLFPESAGNLLVQDFDVFADLFDRRELLVKLLVRLADTAHRLQPRAARVYVASCHRTSLVGGIAIWRDGVDTVAASVLGRDGQVRADNGSPKDLLERLLEPGVE